MVKVRHEVFVDLINRYLGKREVQEQTKDLQNLEKTNQNVTQSTSNLNSQTEELNQAQDNSARTSRRMLFGHLGVMFAGMALNRAMSNLTETSREWVGVGEIMSTTLGVVMLPATIDLLEKGVIPLSNALLSIPEGIQEALGLAVFGLQGLGAIMQTAGQILLGAGAFKILFPELAAKVGAGLTGAFATGAGVLSIGVGVVLAYQSVVSEGGESLLFGLGSAVAFGMGAVLVGASAATGIVVAGITLAAIVAVKMIVSDIETERDLQERMQNKLFETATPLEQVLRGFSPTGGQGTIVNFGRDERQRLLEDIGVNASNLFVNQPLTAGLPSEARGQEIVLNQTNNIQVADLDEFATMITQNNSTLVNDLRVRT